MSKFTHDLKLVEVGAPPKSTSQLLGQLDMHGKPATVQRAAVAAWLEDHEPVPILRLSLEYCGLLPGGGSGSANGHSAES